TEILNGSNSDSINIVTDSKVLDKYYSDEYSGNFIWAETIDQHNSFIFDYSNQSAVVNKVKVETDFTLSVDSKDIKSYDVEYMIYQRVADSYTGDCITVDGKKYVYVRSVLDDVFDEEVIPGMLIRVVAVKQDVGANVKVTHEFYVGGAYVGKTVDRSVVDTDTFKFAPYNTAVGITTTSNKVVTIDASTFDVLLKSASVTLKLENGAYSFNVVDGREYEFVLEYRIDTVKDAVDGEVGVNQSASAIEGDGLYDVITTVTSVGNSSPIDLVFVVDTSSAMGNGAADTMLMIAKEEIKTYIAESFALNSNVRVAIIAYADKYTMVTDGYVTTQQAALNAVDKLSPAIDKDGYSVDTSNLQAGLYAARNLINSDSIGSYTDVIVIKGSEPNASYTMLSSAEAYNYSVVTSTTISDANYAADWEISRMSASTINEINLSESLSSFGDKMTEIFDARNYINVDAGLSITVNTDDFNFVAGAGVYVDFNGDGVFDESERLTSDQYNYIEGRIILQLGTLKDDVRVKHTLELRDKVNGDYFVSD
ncbi:MAG: VWA domain-containing protein, partial [Clostridia bacterium]|nr:VWA domain-containing protein [Clostridia bacterium]